MAIKYDTISKLNSDIHEKHNHPLNLNTIIATINVSTIGKAMRQVRWHNSNNTNRRYIDNNDILPYKKSVDIACKIDKKISIDDVLLNHSFIG